MKAIKWITSNKSVRSISNRVMSKNRKYNLNTGRLYTSFTRRLHQNIIFVPDLRNYSQKIQGIVCQENWLGWYEASVKSYQIEKGNNLCNKVRFKVILTLVKTEEAFPFFFFFFFFF